MQLQAGELAGRGGVVRGQHRPGVGAGLNELEPLLRLGPDGRGDPHGGVQFGQPQRQPLAGRVRIAAVLFRVRRVEEGQIVADQGG